MKKFIENRLINKKKTITTTLANHILYYPTPITLNYAWSFGSLIGLFFSIQLITGIFLAMHYNSHIDYAFESVVHIMTDVSSGYLLRYMHANGASMIFILMYIHMARNLFFRSYLGRRKFLWWSGVVLFLLMMATAFIGYVLPWGQMSFWGATVITSLVTAVPVIGENVAYWIWGGFSVNGATLNRFFSIHYLLPFIITGLIFLHLMLLHWVGSSSPTQQPVGSQTMIPFHPYFTVKDSFIFTITLMIYIIIVAYYPNLLGHSDNFIPANPLVTPAHIVPEWYFTPFYAILRACPNKLGGVIGMLSAILVLLLLPFIKIAPTTVPPISSPIYHVAFGLFAANFLILMFLGGQPAAAPFVLSSKFFTITYFYYLVGFVPTYNFLCQIKLESAAAFTLFKTKSKTPTKNKKKRRFTPRLRLTSKKVQRQWFKYPKQLKRVFRFHRKTIKRPTLAYSLRRKTWLYNHLFGLQPAKKGLPHSCAL